MPLIQIHKPRVRRQRLHTFKKRSETRKKLFFPSDIWPTPPAFQGVYESGWQVRMRRVRIFQLQRQGFTFFSIGKIFRIQTKEAIDIYRRYTKDLPTLKDENGFLTTEELLLKRLK